MAPPNNLWDFINESQHIIKANPRHFLTLYLLVFFLFPLSFSFLINPILSYLFINISLTNLQQEIISLLFSLFNLVVSNCGVISITYSVFQFFNDQPLNLKSAIKSIPTSFLPLLATNIVSQAIISFISHFYGLLMATVINGIAGAVRFDNVTILYFINLIASLPVLLVSIYFQVNWTLLSVIVVVESCWGIEPLRRSARLVKGMKGVALSSFFFYGFLTWIFVFVSNCGFLFTTNIWFQWVFFVLGSLLLAMITLSNIAVNTVLYIYCKANHGENIAEEFGREYVNLPFPDGNVSHADVV